MRINSLTITGFGPFAGTEHIDFKKLSAEGLFLIAGKTGAGKSTILDAISYALYNSVPGVRGHAKQLRSHYSNPQTPTEVIIDFESRGRRLRVERSPEYRRPKKRGTGLTTVSAKVAVNEYRDGEWHGVGRTATEANDEIAQVIGLSAAQFKQIILLPQGAFADFLRAQPADREPLLERLFGTARYGLIEDYLRRQRTEAGAELDRISQARRDRVFMAAKNNGLPTPEISEHPSTREVRTHLAVARINTGETVETLKAAAHLADSCLQGARTELASAQQLRADLLRLDKHQELKAQWTDSAPRRRTLETQLRLAEDAVPLHTTYQEWRSAAARLKELEEQLEAVPGPTDMRNDSLKVIAERTASTREALSIAQRCARTWQQRDEIEKRMAGLSQRHTAGSERAEQLDAQLADRTQAAKNLEAQIQALPNIDALEQELAHIQNDFEAVTRLRQALESAQAEHQRESTLAAQLRESENSATSALAELRTRRIAGIAAELAEGLTPGRQCPVCGSTAHPAPAHAADRVTEEQENAAAEVLKRISTQRLEHERAAAGCRSTVERLATELKDNGAAAKVDSGELTQEIADLQTAIDQARTAGRTAHAVLQEITAAREDLAEQKSAVTDKQTALAAEIAQLRGSRDTLLSATAEEDHNLFAQLDLDWPADTAGMRELAQQLQQSLSDLSQLQELRSELEAARTAHTRWQLQWDQALAQSAFVSESEYAQAQQLDATAIRKELQQMHDLNVSLAAAEAEDWHRRAQSSNLGIEQVENLLLDLENQTAAFESRSHHLADRISVMQHELTKVRAEDESFTQSAPAQDQRLGRLREAIALTQIVTAVSADNTRHISLKSFVLMDLFKRVTEAASERLLRMTQGRYSLMHHLERGKKQTSAGLGLLVADEFTGETRDPRTLSGGESFIASLALALGLADTVAATAGGIELDMLFIDEGFGSLDPDALNRVLEVLDQLRAGGRTVGVISHVGSMHETIPLKITVESGLQGSHILMGSQENANTP